MNVSLGSELESTWLKALWTFIRKFALPKFPAMRYGFTSTSSRQVHFFAMASLFLPHTFPYKASSPFVFLLSSILPNKEHTITIKCYTNHNTIILFPMLTVIW